MRTPGFEPGQEAWRASIITTRSHPHSLTRFHPGNVWCEVDINLLFIIFFINHSPCWAPHHHQKNQSKKNRRRFKSTKKIPEAIGGVVWYTNTKDGPYIHAASTWKVDENKPSISSANAPQKAEHPAIYQTDTPLALTKEPVFLTSKRSNTLGSSFFSSFFCSTCRKLYKSLVCSITREPNGRRTDRPRRSQLYETENESAYQFQWGAYAVHASVQPRLGDRANHACIRGALQGIVPARKTRQIIASYCFFSISTLWRNTYKTEVDVAAEGVSW